MQRRYRVLSALAATIAAASAASAARAAEPLSVETPAPLEKASLVDPGHLELLKAPSRITPPATNMARMRGALTLASKFIPIPFSGVVLSLPQTAMNMAHGDTPAAAFALAQIQQDEDVATLGNERLVAAFRVSTKAMSVYNNPLKAILIVRDPHKLQEDFGTLLESPERNVPLVAKEAISFAEPAPLTRTPMRPEKAEANPLLTLAKN